MEELLNLISMTDNVRNGLEICSNTGKSCCPDNCPYYKSNTSCQGTELMKDSLKVIKDLISVIISKNEEIIKKNGRIVELLNETVEKDRRIIELLK